jgi:N-acetylmuramoyl-L-alanine amidase
VLDPAHGGSDTGARGAGGAVEKDVVLTFARIARAELERQGFRVVMTRSDDSNPSYDDRAAIANAHRDAVFISLHLSSTGTSGIARVYSYRFSAAVPASPSSNGLIPWDEAQQPYTEASRRLADILQVELAQRFTGSPAVATAVPVRELRSVAAPAVAIEISSVSVADANTLTAFAPPLVTAISRGLMVYRPASSIGAR